VSNADIYTEAASLVTEDKIKLRTNETSLYKSNMQQLTRTGAYFYSISGPSQARKQKINSKELRYSSK